MTPPKSSPRRKHGLTAFVYAGVGLFILVLLLGPSTDLGARVAMAGVGILSIIFGITRAPAFYHDESVYSRPQSASGWLVILIYVAAGLAFIIGAFTITLD
jgi:hypothetical protein